MSKAKDYKQPTRAELQAMREAKVQGGPVSEAVRREISFLRNVGGAGDDLEWILFNQAWTELGFERIGDWWEQRVLPVLVHVDLRPSAVLAERVIAAIAADEAGLPKAQRRTQREIASIAGTSQSKVSRSRRDARASGSDLEDGVGHSGDPAETAAEAADIDSADGEQNRASKTGSPAAGAGAADQPAPAVNPTEDHRDLTHPGETDDATAQSSSGPSAPAGVSGADAATEPEEPQPPVQLATGDVEGQTPVGVPASAPPIPSWLRAVTAVNAAVYDLRLEDPHAVQLLIPYDLAGELGASVKNLVAFYKEMHEDVLGQGVA